MKDGLYIRVKQALTWLKRNQGILQKDIADKMGMAEASFTRALARVKKRMMKTSLFHFTRQLANTYRWNTDWKERRTRL